MAQGSVYGRLAAAVIWVFCSCSSWAATSPFSVCAPEPLTLAAGGAGGDEAEDTMQEDAAVNGAEFRLVQTRIEVRTGTQPPTLGEQHRRPHPDAATDASGSLLSLLQTMTGGPDMQPLTTINWIVLFIGIATLIG